MSNRLKFLASPTLMVIAYSVSTPIYHSAFAQSTQGVDYWIVDQPGFPPGAFFLSPTNSLSASYQNAFGFGCPQSGDTANFTISALPAGVTANWAANPATNGGSLTLSAPAGTDIYSEGGYFPFTVSLTGGTCSYTSLQGAVVLGPLITGPSTIWWLNGVTSPPSGNPNIVSSLYPTTVVLTALPANLGPYTWHIYSGDIPVTFPNGSTTMTTNDNTVDIKSTGAAPSGLSAFSVFVSMDYGELNGTDVAVGAEYDINFREPWQLI